MFLIFICVYLRLNNVFWMSSTVVIVFARAPRPGSVKTRLVPLLGAEGAAALHAKLIKRTLAAVRGASFAAAELHCAPDADDPFFRHCAARYAVRLVPQCGADLGARMRAACEAALAGGGRALLLGTDCPALTPGYLRGAERALAAGRDAVVGPAEDGGYVLIGLARCDARLFEDIAWGEATVMAQTRARLTELGWRWRELETLWDVDRPQDYERLLASGLLDSRRARQVFPEGK
jgi:rSAM/selenodomain-associated transferase 1